MGSKGNPKVLGNLPCSVLLGSDCSVSRTGYDDVFHNHGLANPGGFETPEMVFPEIGVKPGIQGGIGVLEVCAGTDRGRRFFDFTFEYHCVGKDFTIASAPVFCRALSNLSDVPELDPLTELIS